MDAIISMVAGLIRRRPGRQPSRQDSELSSGGGRVEVMGWGVGDQIPSSKGRVGGKSGVCLYLSENDDEKKRRHGRP